MWQAQTMYKPVTLFYLNVTLFYTPLTTMLKTWTNKGKQPQFLKTFFLLIASSWQMFSPAQVIFVPDL